MLNPALGFKGKWLGTSFRFLTASILTRFGSQPCRLLFFSLINRCHNFVSPYYVRILKVKVCLLWSKYNMSDSLQSGNVVAISVVPFLNLKRKESSSLTPVLQQNISRSKIFISAFSIYVSIGWAFFILNLTAKKYINK